MLIKREYCNICQFKDYNIITTIHYQDLELLLKNYAGFTSIQFSKIKKNPYKLLECKNCKHIYQQYVPNNEFAHILYEIWINPEKSFQYQQTKHSYRFFATMQYEINLLFNYYNRHPSKIRILDFGAGWGDWSILAKACGFDVYACELSQTRIKNLKKHGIKSVTLEEAKTLQFDYIRSDQVFEHLSEPLNILEELVSVLAKDGIIRIIVPNTEKFHEKLFNTELNSTTSFKNSFNQIYPLEHINCFTPKNLKLLGENCRLKKFTFPLNVEYASSTNWRIGNIISNLYKPIINKYFKEKNNMCFKKY